MFAQTLTRRSFVASSAGVVAAAACAGAVGTSAGIFPALAETENTAKTEQIHSLCNGCSNKCGFTAYVVDGELGKMIGDANHPYAQGKLCARGYGYASIATAQDRLTDPLKKNALGEFEPITWDQAMSEIGDKVKAIIADKGPHAIALVHDPRPTASFYGPRYIQALGSPNVYTHGAACNISKVGGYTQAIGVGDWTSDIENSKMTMFIGRNYANAIRPSDVEALKKAHENGAYIVIVDPRCNDSIAFADEWVPINPGTDQALVLAMAHCMVKNGTYDRDYVESQSVGFHEWVPYLNVCTPEWAEAITGIPANTIERLAASMAQAAPASSIEQGWRAAIGCSYKNSGETARTIALYNTMLGCWNQKGGALFTQSLAAGKLDEAKFPTVPQVEAKKLGTDEYPLAPESMGSSVYAADMAKSGALQGMFFYNSNMAAGYSNPEYVKEALDKLDLKVAIDVQMSETCQLADYVLPECSYLERMDLPEFIGGRVPVVTLRDQVLDKVYPHTKSSDEIFTALAHASGVGQYFEFTKEELADAQLKSVGHSLEELRRVGTVAFPEKAYAYGETPHWQTPTGKVQFVSEACEKAGFSRYPIWIEPDVMPDTEAGELRLIGGKDPVHSHTMTANIPALMDITTTYDLTRAWIHPDVAKKYGIKDGDEIGIENDTYSGVTRVKVTERINPTSMFLPTHYGCTSPEQHTAYGVGLRFMDFVPHHIEPGYGSTMSHETVVKIKKVGA